MALIVCNREDYFLLRKKRIGKISLISSKLNQRMLKNNN